MKRHFLRWGLALSLSMSLACATATPVSAKGKNDLQQSQVKKKKKIRKIIKVIKHGDCDEGCDGMVMKKRGFLGVHMVAITKELKQYFGVAEGQGVLIGQVGTDSPAAKAGVKVGDILIEVDGKPVDSARTAQKLVAKMKDGQKATLKVIRNKKPHTLTATMVEKEKLQVEMSRFIKSFPHDGREMNIEIHGAPFHEAMEHVHEYLENLGDEFEGGKFIEVHDNLEKRLKKMEEKIKKLEKKLQSGIKTLSKIRTT